MLSRILFFIIAPGLMLQACCKHQNWLPDFWSTNTKTAPCTSLWKPNSHIHMSSGEYERKPRSFEYDHTSCFLLKARYNCGHNSSRILKDTSMHYSFTLKTETGQSCDLRAMFNHSGGMHELPKHIREWSHRKVNVTHTNVVIFGSSYMRQVFESLVCRHQHLLTNGFLALNGPDMGSTTLKTHPLFNLSDMGSLVPMSSQVELGCHASNYLHFFEPNSPTPRSNNDACSDDVAMVEFPGNFRIYYVFRHFRYASDPLKMLAQLGLAPQEIDIIVTNNSPEENVRVLSVIPAPVLDFDYVLQHFKNKQIKAAGQWFGADNVGMDNNPDTHPCMPGLPDDEADLLLLMLAHNLKNITW